MRVKTIFYLTVFLSALIISLSTLTLHSITKRDRDAPIGEDAPPLGSECVTHIKNEYGEIRLTDTVGYAFEFELTLYESYSKLGFEIPLYGEKENRLIIASTRPDAEYRPKIFVNGRETDEIPTVPGRYKIRLEISHITSTGFCAGNRLSALGFGEIDLLCMY